MADTLEKDAAQQRTSTVRDEHGVLTKAEVKEILGINEATFYRYRKEYPSFKTFRTGRHTKMRRSTLDRFLAELEEQQSA